MQNELHASIKKVNNGYVIYLRKPCEDKDDYHCEDTYICASIDEALKKVEDYFHGTN